MPTLTDPGKLILLFIYALCKCSKWKWKLLQNRRMKMYSERCGINCSLLCCLIESEINKVPFQFFRFVVGNNEDLVNYNSFIMTTGVHVVCHSYISGIRSWLIPSRCVGYRCWLIFKRKYMSSIWQMWILPALSLVKTTVVIGVVIQVSVWSWLSD